MYSKFAHSFQELVFLEVYGLVVREICRLEKISHDNELQCKQRTGICWVLEHFLQV